MHILWNEVAAQEADMFSADGSLAVTQVMPSEGESVQILHILFFFLLFSGSCFDRKQCDSIKVQDTVVRQTLRLQKMVAGCKVGENVKIIPRADIKSAVICYIIVIQSAVFSEENQLHYLWHWSVTLMNNWWEDSIGQQTYLNRPIQEGVRVILSCWFSSHSLDAGQCCPLSLWVSSYLAHSN